MRRRQAVATEVIGRVDQSRAKVMLPDAVDDDAPRERVGVAHDPVRQDTIQDALKILKNTRNFSAEEHVIVLANILTGEGYNSSLQIRTIPAGMK